jgi:hypothetical protein
MLRPLCGGAASLDMGDWPSVSLRIQDVHALSSGGDAAIREIVDALAQVILSASRRGMRFALSVDFCMPVVDMFGDCAPLILSFAMAMSRPDLFHAAQTAMRETVIRFHDPGDAPLVDMVAQLIAHVPQASPVYFRMAQPHLSA